MLSFVTRVADGNKGSEVFNMSSNYLLMDMTLIGGRIMKITTIKWIMLAKVKD